MVRISFIILVSGMLGPGFALAEPETDPRLTRALAVQKVMSQAKEHLQANRPLDAAAVLEEAILYVNGNEMYLALMKDVYIACLKELQRSGGNADRIDHVRRQLRILDPQLDVDAIKVMDVAVAEVPAPAPAPIAPKPVSKAQGGDDPFQQSPLDRQPMAQGTAGACKAFEQRQYAEAEAQFRRARQAGTALTPEECQAWGYCRLHGVVARLNRGDSNASSAALQKEAEEAIQLGGSSLEKFGEQVLAQIRKRPAGSEAPAPNVGAVPAGWQVSQTASFRVFVQQACPQGIATAKTAEQIRQATFDKWFGPAGDDWSPRCDIWLHATATDYAKSTHQSAASPGHASVGSKDGRIQNRRIDLRLDDAGLLEITLPREVAYVVVSDLFPEQPLPRWSMVGMSILAQPPAEVSRYLRAVPRLSQEKKLFSMRDLLKLSEFPEADKITPFYVESVSLVDYLVRLKGARAFALYLREAPRRGYEEALQRHYGIKDSADLQERWLKFAMKGE